MYSDRSTPHHNARWVSVTATGLAIYLVLGGTISLVGWAADLQRLTDWFNFGISIQPNTAFAAILAGSSILCSFAGLRVPGIFLASLVALIGLTTIFQIATNIDLGFINTILMFGREWGRAGVISPGRMGPPASTSWTLLGIALVLINATAGVPGKWRSTAVGLALATAAISLFSIIGYAYGVTELYTLPRLTVIALQTSTFVLAGSISVVLRINENGPTRLLLEESLAGSLLRRFLPMILVLPFFVGFVRIAGERAGLYDSAFGTAVRTLIEVCVLSGIVWLTGISINRHVRAKEVQERAVRELDQRLAAVFASLDDFFITLNREWKITFANDAAIDRLGIDGEVRGRDIREIAQGTLFESSIKNLERAMDRRASAEYEVFDEAENRWYADRVYPTANGGLAIYSRDNTSRKMAESALRESERTLQHMADAMPHVVWIADASGMVHYYNRRVENFGGITKTAESLFNWRPGLHPDDLTGTQEAWTKAIEENRIYEYKHRVQMADGSYRWHLSRAVPVHAADGRPLRWYGTATDIHDLVTAEETLRASEDRFAKFMQHLPGLAWIKDSEGRYLFANESAERAFGVADSGLYGRTDHDIFPRETADLFVANDRLALTAESGIQTVEVLKDGISGTIRESLVSKFVISDGDGPLPLIGGMAIDITDRRTAERDQSFLFSIADRIRTTRDPQKLLADIPHLIGTYLDLDRCLFNEIDLDADTETVHSDFSRSGNSTVGSHKISDYSQITSSLMMSGKTVVNRDSKTDPRTADLYAATYLPSNERSYIAVPMMREGRWVASLWCSDDKPRDWSDREIALLENIAERTWSAVERLRTDVTLRRSQEMFSTLVEAAPFGVYFIDSDFRLNSVNAGAEEVFRGIDPLIGRDFGEILRLVWTEPFATEAIELFRHTLETGEPFFSPTVTEERGNIEAVESYDWQIHRITLPDGRFGVVCYFYNLTAQKRLEAMVRKTAEVNAFRFRFAEALRGVNEAIEIQAVATRMLGGYLGADRCYYGEIGDDGESFTIHRDHASGLPSISGRHRIEYLGPSIAASLRTGLTFVCEDLAEEKDLTRNEKQSYLDLGVRSLLAVPVIRSEKLVAAFVISIREPHRWSSDEVSLLQESVERTWLAVERAASDAALRASTQRLSATYELAPIGIVEADTRGNYLRGNVRFSEITGYSQSELSGTPMDMVTHPDDLGLDAQLHQKLMAGEIPHYEIEKRYVRPDGTQIWCDLFRSAVRDADGVPVYSIGAVTDITERKLTAEALKESQERFQLAQLAGNVGVWDWDIVANRTYWSDTMWSFYGETPHSVNPDDAFWSSHIHAEDIARVKAFLQQTLDSGAFNYRDEFRIVGRSGETLWIESVANITREADGKPIRMYGVNLDVTDRRLNEERIKRSEEQLRLITDSLPALIGYVDNEGRLRFVNQKYSEWFGVPPSALIGQNIADILGDRAYTIVGPHIEQALRGEPVSIHAEVPYPVVGQRFVNINYVPDIAADNSVRGFYSLISDMTEAKRAEDLLRTSEQRMALLMENVTDYAIITLDDDGMIESWNTGAEKMFGYAAHEVIGRSGSMLFTADDLAGGVPNAEMLAARQRGRATDERWYLRKDGSRFFSSGVMLPLVVGRRLTGYAKIATDLTEKKRRSEELQAAHDQLEVRVEQRTRQLNQVNERLRQEVESRKLSEKQRVTLLHRIVSTQEEERKRIARDIHDQLGQRLTALRLKLAALRNLCEADGEFAARVERLQEVASHLDSEVSFLASELRPSVLDDLGLEEALRAYSVEWASHFEIAAKFHSNGVVGKRFGREVETQLYRIAQEALNNIAKHARPSDVTIMLEKNADFLVLIIEDNGLGFDSEMTTNGSAKGLGLVGMRERASLIGADIEIESAPGSGTAIFVRLPIKKRGHSNGR